MIKYFHPDGFMRRTDNPLPLLFNKKMKLIKELSKNVKDRVNEGFQEIGKDSNNYSILVKG